MPARNPLSSQFRQIKVQSVPAVILFMPHAAQDSSVRLVKLSTPSWETAGIIGIVPLGRLSQSILGGYLAPS